MGVVKEMSTIISAIDYRYGSFKEDKYKYKC